MEAVIPKWLYALFGLVISTAAGAQAPPRDGFDTFAESFRQKHNDTPPVAQFPHARTVVPLLGGMFFQFSSDVAPSAIPGFCIQSHVHVSPENEKLSSRSTTYFMASNNDRVGKRRLAGNSLRDACVALKGNLDGITFDGQSPHDAADAAWIASGLVNAVNRGAIYYLGFDLRLMQQHGIRTTVIERDGSSTTGKQWNLNIWRGDEISRVRVTPCDSLCEFLENAGSPAVIEATCPPGRCLAAEVEFGSCPGNRSRVSLLLHTKPIPHQQEWRVVDAAAHTGTCVV